MDAILLTRNVYSLADLSMCPVFRRQWSSIYEAIQDTRPQRQKLMRLYSEKIPNFGRIVLAGDHTAWSRPDAPTLRERTYEHYTQGGRGGRPITPGYGYSTIAWIPEIEGSWALPLRHERITSWENPIDKAVWQLKQVCQSLPSRPITLWDIEYGCAPFVNKTADIKADKLMRLRSNLCLWGEPPKYSGRGKPRVHGDKFKLNDVTTWSEPEQTIEQQDAKLGKLRIRFWTRKHFRLSPHHPMSIILVERLLEDGSPRVNKPMWLAFVGEEIPSLSQLWKLYLRRFAVDHWYRFLKQRLHWTLPKLATPQQCDRWSDLMPLMTWELWLARDIVNDNPLPWQKQMTQLTPGRVAQAMPAILVRVSTPSIPPKPRGKSPGWKKGQSRQRRIRYPIVKKRTSCLRRTEPQPA
ncbi:MULTISPECIES: NF041680 family putative transposase [Nostoc]|uniref:Transposase n=1 Tax=Nostoc punctiforme FACHB-252 TaxID=1357509 RepID=A0ABR8HLN6_NOSPU|nr:MULTISPECIES: NF041680 family putative transposase [Nostoc]MBC1236265.1 transposase [Nostoc sp. 2RC]MBD2615905.1 transposase [Nostoc punctiforme FACHB-252]